MMKELTLRTKDYLVSFGESMSTRIFAAYMNKIGAKARQVCFTFLINIVFLLAFCMFVGPPFLMKKLLIRLLVHGNRLVAACW